MKSVTCELADTSAKKKISSSRTLFHAKLSKGNNKTGFKEYQKTYEHSYLYKDRNKKKNLKSVTCKLSVTSTKKRIPSSQTRTSDLRISIHLLQSSALPTGLSKERVCNADINEYTLYHAKPIIVKQKWS